MEAKSEVNKSILVAGVSQYIERESRLSLNINKIYGIIWEKITQGLQLVLKVNEDYKKR